MVDTSAGPVPWGYAEEGREALRVGVDLVVVADVERSVARLGDRYLARLFTDGELADCRGPRGLRLESLAARFAAKEAVLKVLRPSGSRPEWRDIEVCRRHAGWCEVFLHGQAARLAAEDGIGAVSLSLSHEAGLAVALAVATGAAAPTGEADAVLGVSDGIEDVERRGQGMTSEQRRERIREIVAEHGRLSLDATTIADDDDLYEAGMTSHASVNVMIALEDAFEVEFPQTTLRRATFQSISSIRTVLDSIV